MHKCYNYTKIKKGEPNLEKLKNCLDKWGHYNLALEILNGYYEAYGDTMDVRLRDEIIRNLTDAGV